MLNKVLVFILSLPFAISAVGQTKYLSKAEQAVWQEHEAEIEPPVSYFASDAFVEVTENRLYDRRDASSIKMLCYTKELRKYLCNYLYEDEIERFHSKKEIEENYLDSINAFLLPHNPKMTGEATGYALMAAKYAELTTKQKDTLLLMAVDYARRLRLNPCISFAKEEMDNLKSVLTDKQLIVALTVKNEKPSRIKAEVMWQAIVNAHLEEEQDSSKQVGIASRYYLQEMIIFDRYQGCQDLLQANLEELYMRKPTIVKIYEGIEKKRTIVEKHNKKVGMEYAW